MSEFATMSKKTLSEIVHFVAENEKFSAVESQLQGFFAVPEVRAALRQLASTLAAEAAEESGSDSHELCLETELTGRAKEVFSSLGPSERQRLLSAFGLSSK